MCSLAFRFGGVGSEENCEEPTLRGSVFFCSSLPRYYCPGWIVSDKSLTALYVPGSNGKTVKAHITSKLHGGRVVNT